MSLKIICSLNFPIYLVRKEKEELEAPWQGKKKRCMVYPKSIINANHWKIKRFQLLAIFWGATC